MLRISGKAWHFVCQALRLMEQGEVSDACSMIRNHVNTADEKAMEAVFEAVIGLVDVGKVKENIAYMVMDEFI